MEIFTYSARQLLEVKQWFDENPDGVLRVPIWPSGTYTRQEWHAWFIDCLHNKINRNEKKRGRKDCHLWDTEMRRAATQVNTPRLIVRWLPKDLRGRLSHRLYVEEE